jgi:membrane-associated protease RseP (regulator of RpoE activity)
LNLFTFDYDLTFMVFFLDDQEQVYARYGGRDARGPDELQSPDGLRYTMNSVLRMHQSKDRTYAPREKGPARTIRQEAVSSGRRMRGCFHCHQVKEVLDAKLRRAGKWDREQAWRYPLPDNLGAIMDLHRGNVVQRIVPDSPAGRAGLKTGDTLRQLADVPIHSLADASFALDRAPRKGKIALTWQRAGTKHTGAIDLPEAWRKSDITWRPSMSRMLPTLPLFGTDLTGAEKKALGLGAKQLAFRQRSEVNPRAAAAGIRAGDVILGVDGKDFADMDPAEFRQYVKREYLVGDAIKIDVLREGKRLSLAMTLAGR